MPSYYYIPGTNIINPDIKNIIDSLSQLENIPSFELTTQPDLSSNLFTEDIADQFDDIPIFEHHINDDGSYGFAFIGENGYIIEQVFLKLDQQLSMVTNYPAFLGDENTGYSVSHYNLPVVTITLPYLNVKPVFLGDENTGYSVSHNKLAQLSNVIEMGIERGSIGTIIVEPAFIGENGFKTDVKYPLITYEDVFANATFQNYFALVGHGTYQTQHYFDASDKVIDTHVLRYDYTNTLQIYMNTTKINSKIGVIKDENNNLISSSYSTENRNYSADIITITAHELFYDISVNHIKHLGAFNSYYSNFIEDINNFFGIGAFDPTIFSNTYKPPLDLSNNVIEYNKAYISTLLSQLSGSVKITDISAIIDFCLITNPFKNRGRSYNTKEGFLEGDRFFIKKGVTITFNLDIINNIPSINIEIDTSGNQSIPEKIYNFDICYNNPFNITKTLHSDLLIILKDNIV